MGKWESGLYQRASGDGINDAVLAFPPMDTAMREAPLAARPAPRRLRWIPLLGPALIIGSVLVALRGFAFAGALSDQHPDLLSFWLPRSCLLGDALRSGRLPLWNPHELAGTPYLADPQSGWLSVLWMTLPTLLGCGAGLAAIVVAQPIIAGLGMSWFLRREGLGRPAATAGGLGLSMLLAQSKLAISMPFAGTMAWTPLLLVGAAAFARATGWRRMPWLALAAFAWGQVATAHLSHGVVIATTLAVAVLVAVLAPAARRGATTSPRAALLAIAFVAALPLVNLAILLPHAALLARSSLAEGYTALGGSLARAAGIDSRPVASAGVWSAWPLALAATPGAYLGSVLLLAAPGALRDRRRRALVIAVAGVMAIAYLLTLDLLVGAAWFRRLILAVPYGDVYLHNPGRLRHLWYLGAPILAAIGFEAHTTRPPRGRVAVAWFGAPIGLFLLWPLAAGALPERLGVFASAASIALGVGWRLRSHAPHLARALVAVLAAELLAGALWSSAWRGGTVFLGLEGARPVLVPAPLRWPDQGIDDIVSPGRIARTLQTRAGEDRYLAWIPPAAYFTKGYLFSQRPEDRPAVLLGRAILFGLHDTLGYSPVQLPRYWSYLRATNDLPLFYNAAAIQVPTPEDARLIGIRWLIRPEGVEPPTGLAGEVVVREGGLALVRLADIPDRTSLVGRWSSVPDTRSALAAVLAPGFDAGTDATLEGAELPPPPGASGPIGSSAYVEETPERVVVAVDADRPGLLIVRNAWDRGWSATVDGRATDVLVADALFQGILVPAGTHEVRLTYRDPTIGAGLALSALAWAAIAAVIGLGRSRERRAVA